jgi:GST-like protein
MYKLYGRAGWGSALVEAQLAAYGLPFELIELGDLFRSAEARAALVAHNPITQVPTLVLPDGQVMTESAAITLHLADVTARGLFVPPAGDATRPKFLRWLVYLVANIYPTFTYGDDPGRFVAVEAARERFAVDVGAYAQRLWRVMEAEAGAPWFLGARFSALDLYVAVMTHWFLGPRVPGQQPRDWFDAACPKLHAIAVAADARPEVAGVLARNFAKG